MLLEVYDTNKQVSDLLNIWPPCTQMWQGHLQFQKHKLFELSTQTNRNTFEEKTIKLSEIQPLASKQILASNIHNWKFKFTLEMNFIILCFVAIFSLNSWQRENIEAYFLSQWKIQLQKKRNWILYILLLERCNQKKASQWFPLLSFTWYTSRKLTVSFVTVPSTSCFCLVKKRSR